MSDHRYTTSYVPLVLALLAFHPQMYATSLPLGYHDMLMLTAFDLRQSEHRLQRPNDVPMQLLKGVSISKAQAIWR